MMRRDRLLLFGLAPLTLTLAALTQAGIDKASPRAHLLGPVLGSVSPAAR